MSSRPGRKPPARELSFRERTASEKVCRARSGRPPRRARKGRAGGGNRTHDLQICSLSRNRSATPAKGCCLRGEPGQPLERYLALWGAQAVAKEARARRRALRRSRPSRSRWTRSSSSAPLVSSPPVAARGARPVRHLPRNGRGVGLRSVGPAFLSWAAAQYFGMVGSISSLQARMPPSRFLTRLKPSVWRRVKALALRRPLRQ